MTGIGHGTDIAVLLGLCGQNPETIPVNDVQRIPQEIYSTNLLNLNGEHQITFNQIQHLIFHFEKSLAFHPNGMEFKAWDVNNNLVANEYYYSVGGGFITKGKEVTDLKSTVPPYYCDTADDLQVHCEKNHIPISKLVLENEKTWRSETEIKEGVWKIWKTMRDCVYRGCHTEGQLPGGLNVKRRAANINKRLLGKTTYHGYHDWIDTIQDLDCSFQQIMKWISCFAMAVNEENAGFGYIMQHFALERLIMGVNAHARAEFALDYARQYMTEREAFGRPLSKFQALRHKFVDLYSDMELCKQFNYAIAYRLNKGEYVVKEATMSKLKSTKMADEVIYECLQFLGGYGYIEDYPMARLLRDSRLGPIGGGTSEILREILSKMIIDKKEYKPAT